MVSNLNLHCQTKSDFFSPSEKFVRAADAVKLIERGALEIVLHDHQAADLMVSKSHGRWLFWDP